MSESFLDNEWQRCKNLMHIRSFTFSPVPEDFPNASIEVLAEVHGGFEICECISHFVGKPDFNLVWSPGRSGYAHPSASFDTSSIPIKGPNKISEPNW